MRCSDYKGGHLPLPLDQTDNRNAEVNQCGKLRLPLNTVISNITAGLSIDFILNCRRLVAVIYALLPPRSVSLVGLPRVLEYYNSSSILLLKYSKRSTSGYHFHFRSFYVFATNFGMTLDYDAVQNCAFKKQLLCLWHCDNFCRLRIYSHKLATGA